MATTLSLNSDDSIMITTFWGGDQRSYTIHMFIGGMEMTTTLTEIEFFEMVVNYNDDIEISKFISKPEVTRYYQRAKDPELEKLLDEEEAIQKRTVISSGWNKSSERL